MNFSLPYAKFTLHDFSLATGFDKSVLVHACDIRACVNYQRRDPSSSPTPGKYLTC